ncbi:MAG: polyketide synthase, partial [Myxococcota bacterium]
MRAGRDLVAEIPQNRWDADRFYDPDPDARGTMYTKHAAFVDEIDLFDPEFFGISPREARSMDPQQRLLLEVAWEALEHAAIPASSLSGSATGVFVGIGLGDYSRLELFAGDLSRLHAYAGSGNGFSFAAGRLAYVLGSHGPTLALDTACSSSLVTIHLACRSLRAGESDLALAGGVHLLLLPTTSVFLSRARALSPDGRCKAFSAHADGFGRGEGCGIVVLKRLDDALRDRDRVLAVIRGSAVNHDGPSGGLMVPNQRAQEMLIRSALSDAGLADPETRAASVQYVEAHGTGTRLGDPIEAGALQTVYGEKRSDPLYLGSIKSNIGHLEAAAGVAGVLKTVLALQHGQLPASLHCQEPNPLIPWSESVLRVVTEATDWPGDPRARGAAISSFGMSGTNAHLVLGAAPAAAENGTAIRSRASARVLPISAQTRAALD